MRLGTNFNTRRIGGKQPLYELGMTKLHIITQRGLVVIARISKLTNIYEELDRMKGLQALS